MQDNGFCGSKMVRLCRRLKNSVDSSSWQRFTTHAQKEACSQDAPLVQAATQGQLAPTAGASGCQGPQAKIGSRNRVFQIRGDLCAQC